MTRKEIHALDRWVFPKVRAQGKCDRCGSHRALQVSHLYSRRYLGIRWHPRNLTVKCAACHWWYRDNPIDGAKWVQEFLGKEKFAHLKSLRDALRKDLTVEEVKGWWI